MYYKNNNTDIALTKLSGFLFVFLLVINNILYQTDFQVNQWFLIVSAFLLVLIIDVNKLSFRSVLLSLALGLIYIFSITITSDKSGLGQALFYTLVICVYIFLWNKGYKFKIDGLIFYSYVLTSVIIMSFIFYLQDRTFINPNWIAATLFLLIGLYKPKHTFLYLIFGLVASLFVFESRGSSVMFFVALLICFGSIFLNSIHLKSAFFVTYTGFIILFLMFLHALTYSPDNMMSIIHEFSERGLGGRELALISGYKDLIDSGFIGLGPTSSGGYINSQTEKLVQIHFGILELSLKFSVLIIFFILVLIWRVLQKTDVDDLPMISGGLMMVFFYNGLSLSHLGLNLMLIMMMSKTLNKYRAT